ncbi:MAG TPA: hypothetical protein VH188_00615 [Chthoniobacterales bacterium]|jgi:hypothetical protein|nr:hypothetical protein [Chthoniobacterales bacterium]
MMSRDALGEATVTATDTPSPSPSPTPTATATATATPTPSTRLGNIATRSLIDYGDNVLIAGFIITGTQPKKVIVRGIGPSLDVRLGHLVDPTLELRDASGALIKSNDNWWDSPDKQAIFNTGIQPKNDLESAIVATLPAKGGTYTAILRGVNGGTGIGVVEVYDLDSDTADSKLANISTRGLVLTGDNVMIAGTIVTGPEKQDLIIRALGPSLQVVNKLLDPRLELHGANGELIAENDNWVESPDSDAIFATGLAPTNPYESAIKWTSPLKGPNYTAIVRDARPPSNDTPSPTVTRSHYGTGNTVEVQSVQFARPPVGGVLRLTIKRPPVIVAGQPGDKAALDDTITIAWDATSDDIKAAILASSKFYQYDQNNNLTAGPKKFHELFDSGGGLGIEGNEGSRREPVVTRGTTDFSDFTIQFGTLTSGAVGIRNPWISGLPLVQVDDSSIIYNGGTALVEIYAVD